MTAGAESGNMSDNQGQNRPDQETDSPTSEDATAAPSQVSQPEPQPQSAPQPEAKPEPQSGTQYADRVYRSVPSLISGVLLIALVLWLGLDALIQGSGRSPWLALAGMVLFVPLLAAYTLWPCVRSNSERLVVRNPLRTITLPWTEVESVVAALSVEVRTADRKFQIWAVPVSLRQRKRENRRMMRATADQSLQTPRRGRRYSADAAGSAYPVGGPGLRSRGDSKGAAYGSTDPTRAWADQVVAELNELREKADHEQPSGSGTTVVWTWWLIAPIVVGAVALITLIAS